MMFDTKDSVIRLASKIARLLAAYRLAILTVITILIVPSAMLADCRLGFDSASHLDAGFASLYDLNFDAAQAEFSDWKARHPDNPLGRLQPPALTYFRNSIDSEFCRANCLERTKPFSSARN
jgi:hypothetical protein